MNEPTPQPLGNVDFNDPVSIRDWYLICPAKHGPILALWAKLWPQFADTIQLAGQMLRGKA